MSETLPQPVFDPFAPGFTDDPYPQYAALRAGAPVYEHPFGFWLLTSYEAVSWLLRANLSVEERNMAAGPFVELREQMYGEDADRSRGVSMLDRDPPNHTRLRRLVSKAFTPRAVQALRPRITGLVDAEPGVVTIGAPVNAILAPIGDSTFTAPKFELAIDQED